MLTARGEVMDRVVGLELGADDYLPKPLNRVNWWQEYSQFYVVCRQKVIPG